MARLVCTANDLNAAARAMGVTAAALRAAFVGTAQLALQAAKGRRAFVENALTQGRCDFKASDLDKCERAIASAQDEIDYWLAVPLDNTSTHGNQP